LTHFAAKSIVTIGRATGSAAFVLAAALLQACTPVAAVQGATHFFLLNSVAYVGAAADGVAGTAPSGQPFSPQDTSSDEKGATGPSALQPAKPGKGGGSGGGASGGAGSATRLTGTILDTQDRPISGATFMLGNGASARTDAQGKFELARPASGVPGFAFAPGYATSTVIGADLPEVLHLQRLASADEPFEATEVFVRGTVSWPGGTPFGGTVHYQDDHGSASNPVVVDADGTFALRVETRRGGRPKGVIMALAAGSGDIPMMGISPVFSLLDQGANPVSIPAVKASELVTFQVGTPPAGLAELRSRVEIAVPGTAPYVLETEGATTGQFRVPPDGALAAKVRIAVEASDEVGVARSVVALDPYALPAVPPAFLPVPVVSVQAPARKIRWDAPEGGGVLVELFQSPRLNEPYFDAWLEGSSELQVDAAYWPTTGPAVARVVTMDGPDAVARQVASVRALRLLPTSSWRGGFRLAETKQTFVP
jgi:hypothetical protein